MRFTIYTLGCKVNTYESSVMKDLMIEAGYRFVLPEEEAEIVLINTCTVTNMAHNKSLKIIRHARKIHPNAIILVCGCVSQTSFEEVKKLDVDIVLGNKNKSQIVSMIQKYQQENKKIYDHHDLSQVPFENMCLNHFDHTRAFIKIQDGCNNFCSYCIIPYTRGGVRSKKKEDVLEEVKNLVKNGHQEIVLTGIHTGNYGAEFDHYDFACLLTDLTKVEGLKRIRISSIEMNEINDRVLELIKNNPIFVSHMHIPLQSGSDEILKSMNRKYNKTDFIKKIENLKQIRPDISITTDVIVGFPGETQELFEETIETIKKVKFSKLHVFPYSKRDGTKASEMPNQVSEEEKKIRVHQLLELSRQLEQEYQKQFIGKTVEVLFETYKNGVNYGHTGNYLMVQLKGENCQNKIKKVLLLEEDGKLIGKLTEQ